MSNDPEQLDPYEQLYRLFNPYYFSKVEALAEHARFVHYTSAATLQRIIENKEFWMRNASLMDDYSEIDYGLGLLADAWRGDLGKRLRAVLDASFPGVSGKLVEFHDGWQDDYRHQTFITSISEHGAKTIDSADQSKKEPFCDEDKFGRLSMWRAYARNNGVALVLNGAPFATPSNALAANTHPVLYADANQFNDTFEHLISNIEQNLEFVRSVDPKGELIFEYLFEAFRNFALTTKHPAFVEEREWRVIYTPSQRPSKHITQKVATIRNVPQGIASIPLKFIKATDEGDVDINADIQSLFERLIIGPTEHPETLRRFFHKSLTDAGISLEQIEIVISYIPLRG